MLHRQVSLIAVAANLLIWLALSLAGCKQDKVVTSTEEEAYLSDYEAPEHQWGFINSMGELVIDASFDDVGPFSEGLAAINRGGKWGYINKTGTIVIEPVYRSAWAFQEGFARVLPFEGNDLFINPSGRTLRSDEWAAADDFSEGKARVRVGNSYGYIDSSGTIIIQPVYSRGWNFSHGSCVVEFQERLGLIDASGNYILAPEYNKLKKVANDSIIIGLKNNGSFVFDHNGKLLDQNPDAVITDSDGINISVREGNKMYLKKIGDPESSAGYANILYLNEHMWAGKDSAGYFLLDQNGNPMTDERYTQINKFSGGIAAYGRDDYWGYIDTAGVELTEPVFGLAWDYREGFARAAFKDGIAFIDMQQQLAFYPPRGSRELRDFTEGLAAVMID